MTLEMLMLVWNISSGVQVLTRSGIIWRYGYKTGNRKSGDRATGKEDMNGGKCASADVEVFYTLYKYKPLVVLIVSTHIK